MTENIKGKVVVITGASSGLGEATARRLAPLGARLVLGARRLDRLQALAKDLSLTEGSVIQTDVTQREQVKRLIDGSVKTHGRIDVLINNAGPDASVLVRAGESRRMGPDDRREY